MGDDAERLRSRAREPKGDRGGRDQRDSRGIEEKFLIADDPETIAAELERIAEMGFDRIALGNTSPNPETLFEVMGDEVIPSL